MGRKTWTISKNQHTALICVCACVMLPFLRVMPISESYSGRREVTNAWLLDCLLEGKKGAMLGVEEASEGVSEGEEVWEGETEAAVKGRKRRKMR